MSAVQDAAPYIDAALREDDDGPDERHLIAWVAVGLYESLDPDEAGYVKVTGDSNIAAHLGLLELGKDVLL